MPRALVLFLAAALACAETGPLRGRVIDSRSGEPLARVRVALLGTPHETVTNPQGEFSFADLAAGEYTLQVSTVGYWMVKRTLTLAAEAPAIEVVLTPSTDRQVETLEVRAGPFEVEPTRSAVTLEANEIKNLGSVIADDPLRSVQTLPGVASNNDFDARFTLRGADYQRTGIYLDGVLLHSPFHGVAGPENAGDGSLTPFSGDMIESIVLDSGAGTARFADQSAGALAIATREGSRRRISMRGTASFSNAGALVEGPLGRSRRGSWLVAARVSYLQYLINRTADDDTLAFGFTDVQGRLSYDLTPRHQLMLTVVEANNGLDRSKAGDRLGFNSVMFSDGHFTLANLGWRWAPSARALVTQRGAWMRERGGTENRDRLLLYRNAYGEWVWNGDASWRGLEAGWSVRRQRNDGVSNFAQFNPLALIQRDAFRGTAWRSGFYALHTVSTIAGRLRFLAGGRWDRHTVNEVAGWSPQAGVSFDLSSSSRLYASWGQQIQYPDLTQYYSRFGSARLLPLRAAHYQAGWEQRLGERTRFRVEAYNRADRDILFRPLFDPRLIDGRIFNPPAFAPVVNSLRGYGRGWQAFLQRRTANGFTGWVSYAYGRATVRDGVTGQHFAAELDQRHTVNVFGGYRLRPSVNLSARFVCGSGFPIPGYFRRDAQGQFFLAERRNELRLTGYARLDWRINKAFTYHDWKWTLFAEVVNLFNRDNVRFDTFNGYNNRTGLARLSFNKMFPIIPSLGLAFEF